MNEGNIIVIGVGEDNNIDAGSMTYNNNLPWIKDNEQSQLWDNWNITNRDLIFANNLNKEVFRINLSPSFDEYYIKEVIASINSCY